MRVISNKTLVLFAARHPDAELPLQAWRRVVEASSWTGFSDVKRSFNTVDKVGDFCVFDIGGNKFRLIASIHFNRQMAFIRYVYTHKEYDRWTP